MSADYHEKGNQGYWVKSFGLFVFLDREQLASKIAIEKI